MILNVNNEKCERFDVVDAIVAKISNEINKFFDRSENVINLNIENFDVVLNEIDEIDKIVVIEMLFLFFFYWNFVSKRFYLFFSHDMLTNVLVKFVVRFENLVALFADDFLTKNLNML